MGSERPLRPRPISNGMEDDTVTPGAAADGVEGEEGDEKELDPDMLEDTFDDVDNL